MPTRSLVLLLVPVLAVVVTGCGGSGGGGDPPAPPGANQAFDLGAVRGEVAAATAGFNMLHFDASSSLPVAFTCLQGAQVVALDEWGYGWLAISKYDGHDYEIHTISADGWHRERLTFTNDNDMYPAWSPDGGRIAYTRRFGVNHSDVYVMNADGSGNVNLTVTGHVDAFPSWHPNGELLVFASSRTSSGYVEIHTMDAEGGGVTQITDVQGAYAPAWSPDGKTIAFSSGLGGSVFDIFTCNPDGSGLTNLTRTPTHDEDEPSWSPDSRQIAYDRLAAGGGRREVWAMNADGTNQHQLTSDPLSNYEDPAWSPDGRRIAMHRDYYNSETGIDVIDLSSGLVSHITQQSGKHESPSWLPQPSTLRRLIGAAGTDFGIDPPLGSASPLVIVGLTQAGLVSATSIGTGTRHWSSLKAKVLPRTGSQLAGLAVTGAKIRTVEEDLGRGVPPKVWRLFEGGMVTYVAVFFSGETGRVVSVIAGKDIALPTSAAEAAAERPGGPIRLRGAFTQAYDTRNAARNLLAGEVGEVAIDAQTGEIASAG